MWRGSDQEIEPGEWQPRIGKNFRGSTSGESWYTQKQGLGSTAREKRRSGGGKGDKVRAMKEAEENQITGRLENNLDLENFRY